MNGSSSHAMYQLAANFICRKIILDEWREVEQIPTLQELASILELNPHIIGKALELLEEKSIVKLDSGKIKLLAEAKQKSMLLLREDFEQHDLPELMRKMELIGLTVSDLPAIISKSVTKMK
jgi:DNA-binding transcriptional regulator YhcF (GntR family)